MRKLYLLIPLLFLIYWNCGLFDEESYVGVTFGGNGNDEGYSVQQTTDGGYICVFGNDLVKTNSQGNEEWVKTFSSNDIGMSTISYFNSVQQTIDGGYIITGEFRLDGYDVGLIKTDSNGNKVWIKSFNSFCTRSYNDRYCQDDGGNSVQQTTDGGYIITGFIRNTLNSSNTDIWLIKTDSKGNSEWNDRQ